MKEQNHNKHQRPQRADFVQELFPYFTGAALAGDAMGGKWLAAILALTTLPVLWYVRKWRSNRNNNNNNRNNVN
jgi:hypothetical protein